MLEDLNKKEEEIQGKIRELKEKIKTERSKKEIYNCYYIYPKDCITLAGRIDYRGYHASLYYGDVSYYINSSFQGRGYAYHALVLLSEILKEKGIDSFWITVYKSNIPSVKTIKKYGGKLLKEEKNLLLYELDTRKREKSEEKKIGK